MSESSVAVYPLALGTNTFGWTCDARSSFAVLDEFLAAGGNMIDTADNYPIWAEGRSGGESEQIIGDWIASRKVRDRVIVATKVSRHPDFRGLSRDSIVNGIEASLRRLRTDHVDIYFAHYDDPSTPIAESAAAFEELRLAGKIRDVGLSNFGSARLSEWLTIAADNGWAKPALLQTHYNLVHRREYEEHLASVVTTHEMGVVPYFGLASGFLSGKFHSVEEVRGSDRARFTSQYASPEAFALLEVLASVASEFGVPMATIALSWLRGRPNVVAPVASVRDVSQLGALMASGSFDLEPDARALLDMSSSRIPPA